MEKKTKNILTSAFWIAVAAVLVYFCFRGVDWKEFLQALGDCRWEYVLLSMGLGAVVFWLRGIRWRMLLTPFDPSTKAVTCFNAYNIGMVANLVLPRAGEVLKLGYIIKHSERGADGKPLVTLDKSLGTVVVERLWDAISLAILAAVLLAGKWEKFGGFLSESLSGVGGGAFRWIVAGVAAGLIGFLILAYFLREKGGVWEKTWGFIRGLGSGLVSFRHMKKPWLFLVYTAAIWALYWLMSAAILWALRDTGAFAGLGLTDAFFLMVAGSISSLVPVPGGFGAYHGVVAGALLSIWNIPLGTGMIYASLNHESQILTQAICGLGSYVHESFFRKK